MGSTPQRRRWRMDDAAFVSQARIPVAGEEEGAIEVDEACARRKHKGGSHGERRADHAADHQPEPACLGGVGKGQRLRQAACLVELDVDGS